MRKARITAVVHVGHALGLSLLRRPLFFCSLSQVNKKIWEELEEQRKKKEATKKK